MGTSSNQRSPQTPNWRLAQALIGRSDVSALRQSQELWRAALGDQGDALFDGLGSPLLAAACENAAKDISPSQAINAFEKHLIDQNAASVYFDLGARALARAVSLKAGKTGFVSELFAEVISYYASRDLPSYVAASGRVKTTTDSIALKEQLRCIARKAASQVKVQTDPKGWKIYISKVIGNLQAGGK